MTKCRRPGCNGNIGVVQGDTVCRMCGHDPLPEPEPEPEPEPAPVKPKRRKEVLMWIDVEHMDKARGG